jgi:hypothetical protein
MIELCANCQVCNLPKQRELRAAYYSESGEIEKVVLLDDNHQGSGTYCDFHSNSLLLFGKIDFAYTSTTRCEMEGATSEQKARAIQRCSVWTNLVCHDRLVIVSTLTGLRQLGIEPGHQIGDVFTDDVNGVIVVIPPLNTITPEEMKNEWRPKVRRVLKESGLL